MQITIGRLWCWGTPLPMSSLVSQHSCDFVYLLMLLIHFSIIQSDALKVKGIWTGFFLVYVHTSRCNVYFTSD